MARPFFAMFEHPIVQGLIYIVLLVLLSVLSPPFSKRRALKILHVGQVISLPCPLKKGQAVVSLQGKVWTLYGPDLRKGQMVKIVHMSKDDIYVKPEGETANEC